MKYFFNKTVNMDFDSAIARVTDELQKQGFGILTEIDVKSTFKKKLDVDFRKYTILGACNPQYALKAIQSEDKIGTMLPCNVVVQQIDENQTEIVIIDPIASMQAVQNPALEEIATEIRSRLQKVADNV